MYSMLKLALATNECQFPFPTGGDLFFALVSRVGNQIFYPTVGWGIYSLHKRNERFHICRIREDSCAWAASPMILFTASSALSAIISAS